MLCENHSSVVVIIMHTIIMHTYKHLIHSTGLLVALIGFYSYLWYVNKQRQQQQAVFVMVDKIIGEF